LKSHPVDKNIVKRDAENWYPNGAWQPFFKGLPVSFSTQRNVDAQMPPEKHEVNNETGSMAKAAETNL
jgi:hypothetical protein